MIDSDREAEDVSAPHVMTIKTAGHGSPLLTIDSRESLIGDITDGVGFRHHSKDSGADSSWVMSFSDLEAVYKFALAERTGRNNDQMRPSDYDRIVPAALRLVINDEYKRLQRAVALLNWIQDSFEDEEDSAFMDYADVVRAARDIVDQTHSGLCASNIANAMAERDQTLRAMLEAHSKRCLRPIGE